MRFLQRYPLRWRRYILRALPRNIFRSHSKTLFLRRNRSSSNGRDLKRRGRPTLLFRYRVLKRDINMKVGLYIDYHIFLNLRELSQAVRKPTTCDTHKKMNKKLLSNFFSWYFMVLYLCHKVLVYIFPCKGTILFLFGFKRCVNNYIFIRF